MRSEEEEDRQAVRGSHIDGPLPLQGSRDQGDNQETDLQRAQDIYEKGLEKYEGKEFDAALKLFQESGRLFRKSPNGVLGNALCLSYSGMAIFRKKKGWGGYYPPVALALLFSMSAV